MNHYRFAIRADLLFSIEADSEEEATLQAAEFIEEDLKDCYDIGGKKNVSVYPDMDADPNLHYQEESKAVDNV